MKLVSVNELLKNSERFVNSDVFLHGVLECSEGNVLIKHWPKSERTRCIYDQIWVCTGEGAFRFNHEVLSRIESKRVVVHGIVKLNVSLWPDDPGSLWRVHIQATELTEQKRWLENHSSK